ncbi:hypothetical protein BD309DRAFT_685150 [Dichomitus squalens]|nr:hypothetical protein BD309DRAFT_685150 [Dichomitus squalens]
MSDLTHQRWCSAPVGSLSSGFDGRSTNLQLASAMRVFRPRSGKHLGLLYDAEAIAYDATTVDGLAADSHDDAFNGDGLLLHPIKYDTEAGTYLL